MSARHPLDATRDAAPLRVLQSFFTPGPQTNPYLSQLFVSVPHVVQRPFSWKTALFGRYDVLHLHLADVLYLRAGRLRSALGAVLFLAVLLRIRFGRIALVRTIHNITPHEAHGAVTTWIEGLSARWTTLWIRLNERTVPPTDAPVETILHGDYRSWFARFDQPAPVVGRVLFFGLIRRYKGVEELIAAFSDITDDSLELRIVGRPSSTTVRSAIEAVASADERVSCVLHYVDDEQLAAEVGAAELVVLPYRDMHNSGAAILALSLGRPILVPNTDTNRDLANEVGPDWVRRFPGSLSADTVVDALAAARVVASGDPDLSGREWSVVGAQHADAYERAARLDRRYRRHHDGARSYSE
ncbi:glycosyltransferase [Glaciibacter superstes]|uniref:glycosyltransferase n=1 Tax=Glaciibacter superstes TaxID=501023 RepID=UPI0003B694B7|nr:glycosyltransferase [Glaciibacter superstes]